MDPYANCSAGVVTFGEGTLCEIGRNQSVWFAEEIDPLYGFFSIPVGFLPYEVRVDLGGREIEGAINVCMVGEYAVTWDKAIGLVPLDVLCGLTQVISDNFVVDDAHSWFLILSILAPIHLRHRAEALRPRVEWYACRPSSGGSSARPIVP